ncbi:hypothetical protein EON83_09970 [bacterium]|nr:MAG: hypothetical protein EON83_09970 [bacterium]
MKQLYTGLGIVVTGIALLSLAGCQSSQAQQTEAQKAATNQELAAKRAAIESNPNIPPDKKAQALGALSVPPTPAR